VAAALRAEGMPLAAVALTLAELAEEIADCLEGVR